MDQVSLKNSFFYSQTLATRIQNKSSEFQLPFSNEAKKECGEGGGETDNGHCYCMYLQSVKELHSLQHIIKSTKGALRMISSQYFVQLREQVLGERNQNSLCGQRGPSNGNDGTSGPTMKSEVATLKKNNNKKWTNSANHILSDVTGATICGHFLSPFPTQNNARYSWESGN